MSLCCLPLGSFPCLSCCLSCRLTLLLEPAAKAKAQGLAYFPRPPHQSLSLPYNSSFQSSTHQNKRERVEEGVRMEQGVSCLLWCKDIGCENADNRCALCRGPFKNPIETKCNHYFCELLVPYTCLVSISVSSPLVFSLDDALLSVPSLQS